VAIDAMRVISGDSCGVGHTPALRRASR